MLIASQPASAVAAKPMTRATLTYSLSSPAPSRRPWSSCSSRPPYPAPWRDRRRPWPCSRRPSPPPRFSRHRSSPAAAAASRGSRRTRRSADRRPGSRERVSSLLLLVGRAGRNRSGGRRAPVRFCIVVPILVVFLGPDFIDVTGAHRLVGALEADGAEVHVAE